MVASALLVCAPFAARAEERSDGDGAKASPDVTRQSTESGTKRVRDVDPPSYFRDREGAQRELAALLKERDAIIKGQPAGIDVGQCPPDFQLEPIDLHADFPRWLGDETPEKFEDLVMLSDFAGKAPIILLFGSYT